MLEGIKVITEFLSGIITVFLFFKKYLNRGIRKLRKILRIDDICITMSLDENNGNFILEREKSSSLDYIVWYEKIKKGGKIIVNCKYRSMLEKAIKKTNNETTKRNCMDGIKTIDNKIDTMILMFEKILSSEIESYKEATFSTLVQGVFDICFNMHQKQYHEKILAVYNSVNNSADYFKFSITSEEFNNINKMSEGRIGIRGYLILGEILDYFTDKSIWEYEIIPSYFKQLVISEKRDSIEQMPVENIRNWWVSLD